jgi:hypothetical protein
MICLENVWLMDMGAWVVESVLVRLTYSLEDARLMGANTIKRPTLGVINPKKSQSGGISYR